MKAGGKTVTVRVLSRARASDGAGGVTTTDIVERRMRMRVVNITGLEQQVADQQAVRATHRFYGYWRTGITEANWLQREDDSRLFDIAEVINVREANREMVILGIERKAA